MKKKLQANPSSAPAARPLPAYTLTAIPRDLWRAAKIRAAEEGITLQKLLLDGLRKRINFNKEG